MLIIHTEDATATFAFGRRLGASLTAGDVVCLSGGLGAGKTLLAQGVAAGLAVEEEVTSPTFTVLQVYETGRLPIFHFDLYRLDSPDELLDIGFAEYANGDGVALVEWADKFAAEMPPAHLWLEIKMDGSTGREIKLQPAGERYRRLCEELKDSADSGHGHRQPGV